MVFRKITVLQKDDDRIGPECYLVPAAVQELSYLTSHVNSSSITFYRDNPDIITQTNTNDKR